MPSPKRTRSSIPQIFGQDNRNRILTLLAIEGPLTPPDIARMLRVDRAHVWTILNHFRCVGLVAWKAGEAAELRRFFASEELYAVLRKLGSATRGTSPTNMNLALGDPHLFGGKARTRVLCALALLGEMNVADVATLAGLRHGTVRHVVAHFRREGVLTITGDDRVVRFNDDFYARDETIALATAIGKRIFNARALRAHKCAIEQERAEVQRPSDTPQQAEHLMPFGLPQQARLLLEIARHDTLTCGELARKLGWTRNAVNGVAESLVRHRVVAKVTRGSGPARKRWYALDPRHPLHHALREYAIALGGPLVRRRTVSPSGFPEIGPQYAKGDVPPCIIGEEAQTRIMLALADGATLCEAAVVKASALPRAKARRWLHRLNAAGLLDYRRGDGTMTVALGHLKARRYLQNLLAAARRFLLEHRGVLETTHRCRDAFVPDKPRSGLPSRPRHLSSRICDRKARGNDGGVWR